MINPYYDPSKLGLTMFTLSKTPDYDFNIIAFWTAGGGIVYFATDSGCSCPSPFEEHVFSNLKDFQQQTERVESFNAAKAEIDSWKETIYSSADRPDVTDLRELRIMFVPDPLLIGQERQMK